MKSSALSSEILGTFLLNAKITSLILQQLIVASVYVFNGVISWLLIFYVLYSVLVDQDGRLILWLNQLNLTTYRLQIYFFIYVGCKVVLATNLIFFNVIVFLLLHQ